MIVKCYVTLDDVLVKRVMEKEACTEDEFKVRIQQFADAIIAEFLKDTYPIDVEKKEYKIGDRVAVPFAETKDTALIRHGTINYITENYVRIYGVEFDLPNVGKSVLPFQVDTFLSVDEYAEGFYIHLPKGNHNDVKDSVQ